MSVLKILYSINFFPNILLLVDFSPKYPVPEKPPIGLHI